MSYKLVADPDKCKGCACVINIPCFQKWDKREDILISETRYEEDEEVNRAVKDTIAACPQNAVELIKVG